jgi:hypothetical protein
LSTRRHFSIKRKIRSEIKSLETKKSELDSIMSETAKEEEILTEKSAE